MELFPAFRLYLATRWRTCYVSKGVPDFERPPLATARNAIGHARIPLQSGLNRTDGNIFDNN